MIRERKKGMMALDGGRGGEESAIRFLGAKTKKQG